MSLPNVVAGALTPSLSISWLQRGGAPQPLDGATLSGCIANRYTGEQQPIAGALVITNPAAGQFRWDFAPADVAEVGSYFVQFTATYASGATPAKTFLLDWLVTEALCLP